MENLSHCMVSLLMYLSIYFITLVLTTFQLAKTELLGRTLPWLYWGLLALPRSWILCKGVFVSPFVIFLCNSFNTMKNLFLIQRKMHTGNEIWVLSETGSGALRWCFAFFCLGCLLIRSKDLIPGGVLLRGYSAWGWWIHGWLCLKPRSWKKGVQSAGHLRLSRVFSYCYCVSIQVYYRQFLVKNKAQTEFLLCFSGVVILSVTWFGSVSLLVSKTGNCKFAEKKRHSLPKNSHTHPHTVLFPCQRVNIDHN